MSTTLATDPAAPTWSNMLRWLRGQPVSVQTALAPYRRVVEAVDQHGERLRAESDEALKARAVALRDRARRNEPLDTLRDETFALVREIADREIGLRPYDAQVVAAAVMFDGNIAQMKTGEGKTLAAALTASLVALTGRGVHVLTFNDYLARRDAAWMAPVYASLGLTVGFVQHGMGIAERQAAYRADITYATAKEAGFDLLRMQLVRDPSQVVHRPLHFALVDEADSILIDEARVPLVIAGQRLDSGAGPERVAAAIAALTPGQDFETDENARNVFLTERGCDRLEASLDAGDLYDASNATLLSEVHQALHARVLLRRDVDYLVREDKVELVDVFTGRVVRDRRWPDGLQAAVEAKEGVPVQPGGRILGTLTLQHLLETYDVLSGMTATAVSAAEELQGFYGLKVVVIPESRPCVREDLPDLVFSHRQARDAALIQTILEVHGSGRPLLVGTTSVEDSERLSSQLLDHGIPHQVLNARNDTQEASIIAEAGGLGAVTISTNMAGRGTDIRLGGADERDREQVVALGGLYVIGTSRHESRRIDNQLQGRAGRQGDPGTSRFFVHLEDDLMLRFGLEGLLGGRYIATRQDGPIDHPVVRREIARLQRIVEGQHYDIRRTLWKYASVVRDQSQAIQEIRIEALIGSLSSTCREQAPAKWRQLCDALGTEAVEAVERQITLHHIDRAWEAHLALTSEMRESIHLVKLAGDPPLETFRKRTLEAYWALEAGLEAQIVATFKDLTIQNGQVDLADQGLTPPGATWTYLVDDQGPGGMGFAGVKRVTAGLSALLGSPWATLRRWWLGHS